MKRTTARLGALAAAAALTMLSIAPAQAATVSQAGATALKGSIAGNPVDIASVSAVNDGTGESKSGESHPPISVLKNQALANVGVLAQDATARILENGDGNSAACAGVGGNGASVANVGDSNCITPGDPVGVSIANLNLTGAQLIDPESALAPLEPLNQLGDIIFGQVLGAVSDALVDAGVVLEIGGSLGAVEARCVANPGSATGTANIVDSKLSARIGFGTTVEEVTLVSLPANPGPNTDVLVNLDSVLNTVIDALETQLTEGLQGALAPLTALTGPLRDTVVNTLVAQIAPQLQPLSDNVARIILNKQAKPAADEITVTALSLELLPAAQQFAGFSLIDLQIGEVTCGPNGRFAPAVDEPEADEPKKPKKPKKDLPDVPTTVASGVDGGNGSANGALALAALLIVAMGSGIIAFRRGLSA